MGGTETNYEAAVQIEIELPGGAADLAVFEEAWTALLPSNCPATAPLDAATLDRLAAAGLVVDERAMRARRSHGDAALFGEIFLSLTATMQNPAFFDWPFTGRTTPKKPGNPSYPQRIPDPIANVAVYGAELLPALTLNRYPLNTVYYEKKREIRITAAPLVPMAPDYSVMILERSDITGVDYEITIHRPDSPDHAIWLARCNQSMPGGGRTPRRFGWF